MICACGHWHGMLHCEAWLDIVEPTNPNSDATAEVKRCGCPRFRLGVQGSGSRRRMNEGTFGRNISQGATAFVSPMYHMQAFSLKNPVVLECIERGWYIDIEDRPPHKTDNVGAEGLRIAKKLGIEVDHGFWAPLR